MITHEIFYILARSPESGVHFTISSTFCFKHIPRSQWPHVSCGYCVALASEMWASALRDTNDQTSRLFCSLPVLVELNW